MAGNKEKYQVEFSEQAKKFMDHLLDTKDKEGLKAISEAIEKIKEDPYSAGTPFQTEADDKTLTELRTLIDQQITNIGYWPAEEWEDIECIDITFENKYLLDLLQPEFYKIVDKVGEEYLFEQVQERAKIEKYLSKLYDSVLKEVEYDPEEGLLLNFYDEKELRRIEIDARGWILESREK